MKKLLIVLNCLVSISIASLPIFKNNQTKIDIQQNQIDQKEWNFDPFIVRKATEAGKWLYFSIDNINLSSLGITNIDFLHLYKKIEIPDLVVRFNSYKEITSDSWKTADKKIGSENWFRLYWQVIDNVTMILERAATIWFNNSGDLMMRLAYHASVSIFFPPDVTYGTLITFKSGSVVKFS